ncbi:MAG: fasciclin domain-containing protein [Myxococcota bacterium]
MRTRAIGLLVALAAGSTGCLTDRPTDTRPFLIATLSADSRFSTLVRLLNESGVANELSPDDDWTIFAPTDDAFEKLGDLFAAERINNDGLRAALQYHIAQGIVPTDALAQQPSVDTLVGLPLSVSIQASRLLVGAAVVSGPALTARNGLIHPVDRVLKPPRNTEPSRVGRDPKKPRRPQPDQWWW